MFDWDLFIECLEDYLVELAGNYAVRELIYTVKLGWTRLHHLKLSVPVISVIKEIGDETVYSCLVMYDFASPVIGKGNPAFHKHLMEMMKTRKVAECYRIRNMLFGSYATAKDHFEASLVAGLEMQKAHPDKAKVDSLIAQAGRFRQKEHLPIMSFAQVPKTNLRQNELFAN